MAHLEHGKPDDAGDLCLVVEWCPRNERVCHQLDHGNHGNDGPVLQKATGRVRPPGSGPWDRQRRLAAPDAPVGKPVMVLVHIAGKDDLVGLVRREDVAQQVAGTAAVSERALPALRPRAAVRGGCAAHLARSRTKGGARRTRSRAWPAVLLGLLSFSTTFSFSFDHGLSHHYLAVSVAAAAASSTTTSWWATWRTTTMWDGPARRAGWPQAAPPRGRAARQSPLRERRARRPARAAPPLGIGKHGPGQLAAGATRVRRPARRAPAAAQARAGLWSEVLSHVATMPAPRVCGTAHHDLHFAY